MKLYTSKAETAAASVVVVDDMILTKEMPTAAGSKMLEGYRSLFDAEVITRLHAAGYEIGGKAAVGEFAIDLVGETAYDGACVADGILRNAAAEIIKAGEAKAVLGLDVNGSVRRAAAQNGLISVKPTYGTVSRYGTVPVACSGETVSVMAKTAADCREILEAIAGHDDKDGTSLSEECCAQIKSGGSIAKPAKVAVITGCNLTPDAEAAAKLSAFGAMLEQNGISVTAVDAGVLTTASAAWNILMSAELCNNVSRYDVRCRQSDRTVSALKRNSRKMVSVGIRHTIHDNIVGYAEQRIVEIVCLGFRVGWIRMNVFSFLITEKAEIHFVFQHNDIGNHIICKEIGF